MAKVILDEATEHKMAFHTQSNYHINNPQSRGLSSCIQHSQEQPYRDSPSRNIS